MPAADAPGQSPSASYFSLADLGLLSTVKGLIMGFPGAGKTTALASLVLAGYHLRIVDLDNKLLPLYNMCLHFGLSPQDFAQRVECIGLHQAYQFDRSGSFRAGGPGNPPTVYPQLMQLLTGYWPNAGPLESWPDHVVLVIDGLSELGDATMTYVQHLNGRFTDADRYGPSYGTDSRQAQDKLKDLFRHLKGARCNVLFTAHLQLLTTSEQGIRLFPNAPGQKLAPEIGRFFDMAILVEPYFGQGQGQQGGQGGNASGVPRLVHTQPRNNLDLRVPVQTIPATLWADLALAQIFETCRGRPGPAGTVFK